MSKSKKSYQDWCIDTLFAALQAKDRYQGVLEDQGYIYVLKAIINHYASMCPCTEEYKREFAYEKEHVNLWWDHLNKKNRDVFFANLLRSKKAQWILEHTRDVKQLKKKLHLEHITPCGFVYKRLCALWDKGLLTRKRVADELKYERIVLLAKDGESKKILDKKGCRFDDKDIAACKECFPELAKEVDSLSGALAKSEGFGLLRMIRLHNHGVDFLRPTPNGDVAECPPEQWKSFFDEDKIVIDGRLPETKGDDGRSSENKKRGKRK